MSICRNFYLGALLVLLIPSFAMAEPDIAAGQEKAGMCFGCHGAEGNSKNPNFPSLAGQKPAYLVNQLRAFREGTRQNGMMQNMAANLTNQEIINLAAFFATVENISAVVDTELAAKGESKAPMCFGCHGNQAIGMGVTPRLAGQQPVYLQHQLQAFKDGTRKNGPMRGISNMLSAEEIKAVTAYLGSLK